MLVILAMAIAVMVVNREIQSDAQKRQSAHTATQHCGRRKRRKIVRTETIERQWTTMSLKDSASCSRSETLAATSKWSTTNRT